MWYKLMIRGKFSSLNCAGLVQHGNILVIFIYLRYMCSPQTPEDKQLEPCPNCAFRY